MPLGGKDGSSGLPDMKRNLLRIGMLAVSISLTLLYVVQV